MPDSWLPPWLTPVADSVRSAADPFADWLRSQGPANDVPPPSPGYDAAVAGIAPWESRPVPDLGGMAKDALRSTADAGGYPEPRATIGTEPVDGPVTQPGQYAGPPNEPASSVEDGMLDVASAQDATARSAEAGPVTQPGQDAGPPNEPTAAIAWHPPFAGPVGYMPPPVTPGPDGPMPAGSTFDQPGDYAEPRSTIAPDPMDTAGGFDAKVDEYAADPELLLRTQMDRKAALEAMQAKALREQAEKEKADLERSIQVREQARAKALADRAQIEQDARALADGTPFGNWWASRSTGQKVSNYIAAIFGGLMQGSTGGRNSAIDLMMKAADDDANQKWKSLEMRRQMSGEDLNDADAEYKFKETARAASLQQMKNELQARMAGFDLQGKAAQDAGATLAALDAAQAEQRAKGIADAQKQMLDAFNADTQRITAEAQMKNADSLAWQRGMRGGLGGAGGGGGGAGAGASTAGWGAKDKHTGAEWADHYGIPPDMRKNLNIDERTDGKSFNDWFEKQKALGQMSTDAARNVSIQQGVDLERRKLAITFDGVPLYEYTPDGKPVVDSNGEQVPLLAPTETEGAQIRAEIANTVKAIRALYEIKAIRDRMSVGDSKLPWKDAAQRLASLQADVIKNMKAGTQGMSSDEDMNKIAAAAGVKDATSFLAQTAAIDQGIRNAINNLHTDLRQHYRYNGPALDIPNPHAGPPARSSVVDQSTAAASTRGSGTETSTNAYGGPLVRQVPTGAQSAAIDSLAAAVGRKDKDAPDAVAGLIKAATSGSGIPAREKAAAEFWRLKRSGNADAVAAYDKMSTQDKAQLLTRLPEEDRWQAIHEALPDKARPVSRVPESELSVAVDGVATWREEADRRAKAGDASGAAEFRARADQLQGEIDAARNGNIDLADWHRAQKRRRQEAIDAAKERGL